MCMEMYIVNTDMSDGACEGTVQFRSITPAERDIGPPELWYRLRLEVVPSSAKCLRHRP